MAKIPSTADLLLAYTFGVVCRQFLRFYGIHLFNEHMISELMTPMHAFLSTLFLLYPTFYGRILKTRLTVMESLETFAIFFYVDKTFRSPLNPSKSIHLLIALLSILLVLRILQKCVRYNYVRFIDYPNDVEAFLRDEYPNYSNTHLIFIWLFEWQGPGLFDFIYGHASMQLAIDSVYNYISNWPSNLLYQQLFDYVASSPHMSLADDMSAETRNPNIIICVPKDLVNTDNIIRWFRELKDNEAIRYHFLDENCTHFIRSALLKGGLELLQPWVGMPITTLTFPTDVASHIVDTIAYRKGDWWLRSLYRLSFFFGFSKMIFLVCLYAQVFFYFFYLLFPQVIPVQNFPYYTEQWINSTSTLQA